jgi:PAP2 superfamily
MRLQTRQTRNNCQSRLVALRRPVLAWRSLVNRHPAMRFTQIIPIALLLWGLDDVARFRAGAAAAGRHNALVVNSVSSTLGGASTHVINNWTVTHGAAALASSWYYILFQGAITGVVGAVILWRRVPTFPLHRNALVTITLLGLVAFWEYPVAPPRMLPGYHDVIAVTIPSFTSVVETNGAAQYASLPSLHIAWALWAAIALCTVVRKPVLRVLVWLYPFVTAVDVLATGNHYLLDIITAPGLLVLGYAVALTPAFVRRLRRRDVLHRRLLPSLLLRYLTLRELLVPGQLLPSRYLDGDVSHAWPEQGQLIPRQRHPPGDPRLERRLACAGIVHPDHGRSPGER